MSQTPKTAERIRRLEIQGAAAIAKAALSALAADLDTDPRADGPALAALLCAARPNEPMLRNLLALLLGRGPSEGGWGADADHLLTEVREGETRIAAAGADLVREGMTVFTHCHSSSAVGILLEAHRRGVRFTVRNTETRPRYQGRITARELAEAGVEVIHMVDAAAKWALDGADLFLFGADAVLPSGYLINKVGTGIFCLVARSYGVPAYCAAHTLKVVRDADDGTVEQRAPAEVWPDAPAGVRVLNPAFDRVHLKYITAFVTEIGPVADILAAASDFKAFGGCAILPTSKGGA
jgi:ribose 1,5-bisphosphate isomerase